MKKQDFIRCRDLSRKQLEQLLQTAKDFKRGTIQVPLFFDVKPQIATFFLENSTRTKLSFEIAAQNLGTHQVDFRAETSSLAKGESVLDSFRCLEAMGVKACVVRWTQEDLAKYSEQTSMSLISAGEGKKSHPSQALLDYLTWSEYQEQFEGKSLLIVGDIRHSRVAHSHLEMAKLFGVDLKLAGPKQWMPEAQSENVVDFDSALESADLVMMLRVQKERHQTENTISDYNAEFGLNQIRLKKMKKEALIFHPGPFNLGTEITQDVLEDHRCKIWNQVENGVWVRMAILKRALEISYES